MAIFIINFHIGYQLVLWYICFSGYYHRNDWMHWCMNFFKILFYAFMLVSLIFIFGSLFFIFGIFIFIFQLFGVTWPIFHL